MRANCAPTATARATLATPEASAPCPLAPPKRLASHLSTTTSPRGVLGLEGLATPKSGPALSSSATVSRGGRRSGHAVQRTRPHRAMGWTDDQRNKGQSKRERRHSRAVQRCSPLSPTPARRPCRHRPQPTAWHPRSSSCELQLPMLQRITHLASGPPIGMGSAAHRPATRAAIVQWSRSIGQHLQRIPSETPRFDLA